MAWTDWEGEPYTLKGEWTYATTAVVRKDDSSSRDRGNDRKGPQDFCEHVNAFIKQRRGEGHDGHSCPRRRRRAARWRR